jgi:hypothetical protein
MKKLLIASILSIIPLGVAKAAPGGPPAGNPILNSPIYQRRSEINIDTATIKDVRISTFVNVPSLPYGIIIDGEIYNSSSPFSGGISEAYFLTSSSAASTYLSVSSAMANFQPAGSCLTNSSATATYLTKTNAAAAYLTQSSASITYAYDNAVLHNSSATATYLNQSSAAVTYAYSNSSLSNSSATATYLQNSSASLTYMYKNSSSGTVSNLNVSTINFVNGTKITSGNFGTDVKKLVISWQSNHTNHVLWDYVRFYDSVSSTTFVNDAPGSIVTTDLDNSGVNGLDTGSKAANKWYYVFLIGNSNTGSTNALYSLSPTAPTMPSGYVYKKMVGFQRTDTSSNTLSCAIVDNEFMWDTPKAIVSNDTTHTGYGVETKVDMSSYVPPAYAWSVTLAITHGDTYSASGDLFQAAYGHRVGGSQQTIFNNTSLHGIGTYEISGRKTFLFFNESASDDAIYWSVDSTSANRTSYYTYVYVEGFRMISK